MIELEKAMRLLMYLYLKASNTRSFVFYGNPAVVEIEQEKAES